VRIDRLSLIASSKDPSVPTSAIPTDKIGKPKEKISCFKKGGAPFAQVMTMLLFLAQKDIKPPRSVARGYKKQTGVLNKFYFLSF
jgi:hypothetical protein